VLCCVQIHITPQPNCSYASFETNIPPVQTSIPPLTLSSGAGNSSASSSASGLADLGGGGSESAMITYSALVNKNIAIFGPGKFTLTLFANDKASREFGLTSDALFVDIPGYRRSSRVLYEFTNYKLSYCHYVRINDISKTKNGANATALRSVHGHPRLSLRRCSADSFDRVPCCVALCCAVLQMTRC
jgi:hypothetical protein